MNTANDLTQHLVEVDNTQRVMAFQAMIDDLVLAANEDLEAQKHLPDLTGMKFTLDLETRVLTCRLDRNQMEYSMASIDPYLFQALTVGEIIDAAKVKFAEALAAATASE